MITLLCSKTSTKASKISAQGMSEFNYFCLLELQIKQGKPCRTSDNTARSLSVDTIRRDSYMNSLNNVNENTCARVVQRTLKISYFHCHLFLGSR